MDLVHPYRLVFERLGDVVQIARIVEILDCVKWITTKGMVRRAIYVFLWYNKAWRT